MQGDEHPAQPAGQGFRADAVASQAHAVDAGVAGDVNPGWIDADPGQIGGGDIGGRKMQGGELADDTAPAFLREGPVQIEGAQTGLDMTDRDPPGEGGHRPRGRG